MNQGSKQFIEASFEKWTDIIRREFDHVNGRLDKVEENLSETKATVAVMQEDLSETKATVAVMQEDLSETKAAVFRMEHSLQDRVEGQEDAILSLEKRTNRIEDEAGLPHILAA